MIVVSNLEETNMYPGLQICQPGESGLERLLRFSNDVVGLGGKFHGLTTQVTQNLSIARKLM